MTGDAKPPDALAAAASLLRRQGYGFVAGETMRHALGDAALAAWDAFSASWDDLGDDLYMADGGRYRRRRHAVFTAKAGGVTREPDQPHYQSRDHNRLNGGIERWFRPITAEVARSPMLLALLDLARRLFEGLPPPSRVPVAWRVELHQFRIEASHGAPGQPTPEGAHRDGVDWVLVLLVRRQNVRSGETTILDPEGRGLGAFTLTAPLDAALVDDARVLHGVTAIVPENPALPALRDVLVITFRAQ